jgi:acyl-CoA thioesterase
MAIPNPMPAAAELGIEVLDGGTCRLAIAARHLNEAGVAHGGVLFTLADTALGLAAGPSWVGTQFSLQLMRGVRVGDVIVAHAREEHRSRRLLAYAVRLERDGALVGTLTAQLLTTLDRPEQG